MAWYPPDVLGEYQEDDGTMPGNVDTVREAVVGHRIVSCGKEQVTINKWGYDETCMAFVITLDNGTRVALANTSDCCAYTELEQFLLHPDKVDHVIMGVATTEGYTKWHVYADYGDILELTVGWSCGNAFYYGYGFNIDVKEVGS